jgi:sec-independent protein translocase protein TatA
MFNISKEMIIIVVIVMIIFGPKQIPKLAKMAGGAMKSVRDGIEGKVEDDESTAPKAVTKAVDETEAEAASTVKAGS